MTVLFIEPEYFRDAKGMLRRAPLDALGLPDRESARPVPTMMWRDISDMLALRDGCAHIQLAHVYAHEVRHGAPPNQLRFWYRLHVEVTCLDCGVPMLFAGVESADPDRGGWTEPCITPDGARLTAPMIPLGAHQERMVIR